MEAVDGYILVAHGDTCRIHGPGGIVERKLRLADVDSGEQSLFIALEIGAETQIAVVGTLAVDVPAERRAQHVVVARAVELQRHRSPFGGHGGFEIEPGAVVGAH